MEAEVPLPDGEGPEIPGVDNESPVDEFNEDLNNVLDEEITDIPLESFKNEFGENLQTDLQEANIPERMSDSFKEEVKNSVEEEGAGPDTQIQRAFQKGVAKALMDNQEAIKADAMSNLHKVASTPEAIADLSPEDIQKATGDAIDKFKSDMKESWKKQMADATGDEFTQDLTDNGGDPNDPDAQEYNEKLKKAGSDQIDPKNRATTQDALDNAETPNTPENEGAQGVQDDIENETYGSKVKEWFKENWGKALGGLLAFSLFVKMILGGENPLDPNNWLKELESLGKGLINTILNLLKKLWELFYNHIVKPVGKLLGKVIWYILGAIAVLIVIGLIVKFGFSRIGKGKDRGKVIGKVYAT